MTFLSKNPVALLLAGADLSEECWAELTPEMCRGGRVIPSPGNLGGVQPPWYLHPKSQIFAQKVSNAWKCQNIKLKKSFELLKIYRPLPLLPIQVRAGFRGGGKGGNAPPPLIPFCLPLYFCPPGQLPGGWQRIFRFPLPFSKETYCFVIKCYHKT